MLFVDVDVIKAVIYHKFGSNERQASQLQISRGSGAGISQLPVVGAELGSVDGIQEERIQPSRTQLFECRTKGC